MMHNIEQNALHQLGFATFTKVTLNRLQPDPSFPWTQSPVYSPSRQDSNNGLWRKRNLKYDQ